MEYLDRFGREFIHLVWLQFILDGSSRQRTGWQAVVYNNVSKVLNQLRNPGASSERRQKMMWIQAGLSNRPLEKTKTPPSWWQQKENFHWLCLFVNWKFEKVSLDPSAACKVSARTTITGIHLPPPPPSSRCASAPASRAQWRWKFLTMFVLFLRNGPRFPFAIIIPIFTEHANVISLFFLSLFVVPDPLILCPWHVVASTTTPTRRHRPGAFEYEEVE